MSKHLFDEKKMDNVIHHSTHSWNLVYAQIDSEIRRNVKEVLDRFTDRPYYHDMDRRLIQDLATQIKKDRGTSALRTSLFLVDVIDPEHY